MPNFRYRRPNKVNRIVPATLIIVGVLATTAITTEAVAAQPEGRHEPSLTTEQYFNAMRPLIQGPNVSQPQPGVQNAWSVTVAGRDVIRATLKKALDIKPPRPLVGVHTAYLDSLRQQEQAWTKAAARTPFDAPASDQYAYVFSDTAAGYGFGAETDAGCRLRDAAARSGIENFPSRVLCYEKPKVGKTVGTRQAPVNEVRLTNEPLPESAGAPCPRVDYEVTHIVARAGAPITITFDNRNPLPCLFNLAVYKGNKARLVPDDQIAATTAAGAKVHTLTLTLEPGRYAFADNVHPYVMRGVLDVVG
jgi:hypothetical protein